MVDLGTLLTYRGRLHVVVGVTPMGATPRLFELEDVESGRIRRVEWTDPGLDTGPNWRRSVPLQRDARVVVVDDDTFFVEAMLVLLPQLARDARGNNPLRKTTAAARLGQISSPVLPERLNPALPCARAPVAQWIEQRFLKPRPAWLGLLYGGVPGPEF